MLPITKQYLSLINANDIDGAADYVETLSNDDKMTVRRELESIGDTRILRNLTYDYQNQRWLMSEAEIQAIMAKHGAQ